jgi:hypothetical protein
VRKGLSMTTAGQVDLGRRPWTKEDLIVAWDGCPKDSQRYNQRDPRVLDLAQLLDRTPSSIDRIFANFWWTWSGGTQGLENSGSLEQAVVNRYSNDLDRLARDASSIRRKRVEDCLWPRMMLVLPEGQVGIPLSRLAPLLRGLPLTPRQLYINFRKGSLIEDITFFFIANPQAFAVVRRAVERITDAVVNSLRGLPKDRLLIQSDGLKFLIKGDLKGYETVAVEHFREVGGDPHQLRGNHRERLAIILSRNGALLPAMKRPARRGGSPRKESGRQLRLP